MPVDLGKYCQKLERTNPLARGTVLRVAGMIVESRGPMVGIGQLCEICPADGRRVPAEVVGFHQENRILLPLEKIEGVAPGDPVAARTAPRTIMLDQGVLGRVIDPLGRPIDNLGPLRGRNAWPLDNAAPAPMSRQKITHPLAFGIRAIDGLLTCRRGQRMGIFAGSGVGKSTLLGEIAGQRRGRERAGLGGRARSRGAPDSSRNRWGSLGWPGAWWRWRRRMPRRSSG